MNKKRLLKLADLLEADAKNKKGIKFDMYGWGVVSDPLNPVSCGTAACAMGLAALSGAFKRAGLDYYLPPNASLLRFTWKGVATDGFTAGAALFGISEEDSMTIFSADTAHDTGASAERRRAKIIRQFVARS